MLYYFLKVRWRVILLGLCLKHRTNFIIKLITWLLSLYLNPEVYIFFYEGGGGTILDKNIP